MSRYEMSESGTYGLRIFAAELIREATERGDQDAETVTWCVGQMLRRADDDDAARRLREDR